MCGNCEETMIVAVYSYNNIATKEAHSKERKKERKVVEEAVAFTLRVQKRIT